MAISQPYGRPTFTCVVCAQWLTLEPVRLAHKVNRLVHLWNQDPRLKIIHDMPFTPLLFCLARKPRTLGIKWRPTYGELHIVRFAHPSLAILPTLLTFGENVTPDEPEA